MTAKNFVIYGAGDMGRVLVWLLEEINAVSLQWNVLGFIDDTFEAGTEVFGVPVLGGTSWFDSADGEIYVNCALGNPDTKKAAVEKLSVYKNIVYPVLMHPTVRYSKDLRIGGGSVVYNNCVILPDVNIGRHVLINSNCEIAHDDVIGDYTTLSAGINIGGWATIGESDFIGIGSCIAHRVSVGDHTVIGAGAAVVKDIPSDCIAVGVPARPIKQIKPGEMYF
jgi:sugar O-acyltransferase (sialic acid O-acetyltransferase NeuD family)